MTKKRETTEIDLRPITLIMIGVIISTIWFTDKLSIEALKITATGFFILASIEMYRNW